MNPLDVRCPKCGMGQGMKCRSLTTHRSTDTHEARYEQARLADAERYKRERESEASR